MNDKYSYPDPGDEITFKIIQQYEALPSYWSNSEKRILSHIHETIRLNSFSNYTLLDAGCGEGRLFDCFINDAARIVGIEPDRTRYENALRHISENRFESKVEMRNVSVEESRLNEKFDVVLSSHIIQHIPTASVAKHLSTLAEATHEGGLLIINTNVSNRDEEYFVKGCIDKHAAGETEIDRQEFDRLTSQTGQLPIHMFDRTKLKNILFAKDFELLSEQVFHIEPKIQEKYGANTDRVVNADESLKKRYGRDICMIFRKRVPAMTIRRGALAEFCAFNVRLYGIGKEKLVHLIADVKKRNAAIIDTSHFCTDEDNRCNAFRHLGRDIAEYECLCGDEADKFCSTGQTVNISYRYYIGTTYFNFLGRKTVPLKISVTFFPYRNIGIVCFNTVIENMSADEVILLKQYFGNTSRGKTSDSWRDECKPFFRSDAKLPDRPLKGEYLWFFCHNFIDEISETLDKKGKSGFSRREIVEYRKTENERPDMIIDDFSRVMDTSFVFPTLEINDTDYDSSIDDTEVWTERNCEVLYGMLVGDEGYRYVSRKLALDRLRAHKWGTRRFMSISAYSQNSIMLNFKHDSDTGQKYMSMEREWSRKKHEQERNIYFTMKPCIAGVDHGLFRVIERNIVIHFENDYISKVDKSSAIALTKKRRKILLFLQKTTTAMDEINDLFNTIARASGTADIIDSIKQRLALRSEEKSLRYQFNNNFTILVLTFMSIVLGFLAIASGSPLLSYCRQRLERFVTVDEQRFVVYILGISIAVIVILCIKFYDWRELHWNIYSNVYKYKRRVKRFLKKINHGFKNH